MIFKCPSCNFTVNIDESMLKEKLKHSKKKKDIIVYAEFEEIKEETL